MIRGFFNLLFRLIALIFLIVLATVIWIVYDGLSDHGDHADVAVVPGNFVKRDGLPGAVLQERLDKAVELYQDRKYPRIIVSGATKLGGYDEPAVMANYLVEHQVPRSAIIMDKNGANTSDTGADVARIMRFNHMKTVMIVTNYYHVTRLKLSLQHAGIHDVEQAHVGTVTKEDGFMVAREVAALYYYLGRFYLIPAAQQAQVEAKAEGQVIKQDAAVEGEKAKEEADKLKQKVNEDIESMQTNREPAQP